MFAFTKKEEDQDFNVNEILGSFNQISLKPEASHHINMSKVSDYKNLRDMNSFFNYLNNSEYEEDFNESEGNYEDSFFCLNKNYKPQDKIKYQDTKNEDFLASLQEATKATSPSTQNPNSNPIQNDNKDPKTLLNVESNINNISEPKTLFKTLLYHKRGRHTFKNSNKQIHSSMAFDNIQRKIQTHYLTFLVNFSNDFVNSFLGYKNKCFFKQIKYTIKREINYNSVKKLKEGTFADFLKMDITSRYENINKNFNRQNLDNLYENYPQLKEIFELNFLEIFQKYYFNEGKPLKEIFIGNKKIEISSKIENYCNLKKKCSSCSDKLDMIIKNVYFYEINYLQKKKFKIIKE